MSFPTMTEILVTLGFVTCFGSLAFLYFSMRNLHRVIDLLIAHQDDDSNELLSPFEMEQYERALAFDQRINEMKNELAMQESFQRPTYVGTIADELDPHVKNLPHEIVKSTKPSDTETGVEYID